MLMARQSASSFNGSRVTASAQDQRHTYASAGAEDAGHYLRIVREFTRFLRRPPDPATVEDLWRYQLHLVDHGTSPVSLNAASTGLKFFFEITLPSRRSVTAAVAEGLAELAPPRAR
ncbi:hypothetical protein LMG28727_06262 [Paraburkholderia kirstenboschensis]|nr:hypothetical protein LMG28727_06262 [Paraburkholderia kirstenboschensis]